jgi:hypothetical protein
VVDVDAVRVHAQGGEGVALGGEVWASVKQRAYPMSMLATRDCSG